MKLLNSKLTILLLFLTSSFSVFAVTRALNIAATGMAAQEANITAISNNIANANTTGFKLSRVEFEDLMYETITEAGGRSSSNSQYNVGVQIGSGAKVGATRKVFSQGSLKITNNPFDLAINGDGFFGIITNDGSLAFTRDGSFNVDHTGILVNSRGYKVFPTIQFPPTTRSVNITETGAVEAFLNGQPDPQNVGQIPVFMFVNPVGLRSMGSNLYAMTKSSGNSLEQVGGNDNTGVIKQGQLETSNVNIMNEMTGLIKAQRTFELNAKVMKAADEILQTVNNLR
ncbi:MAG: flagellar basal-body rod protein FlgG [Bacteriovoracaceae bacterium]|nr:flagellar basal-body rod protein FlgG [Bacteriovoracaceae bacterium]